MGGIGIGMAFKQPTPAADGGEDSWWLSGGVSAENCVAAYQAKGAASYAASKVNLANPGTHDLTDGDTAPAWDAGTGWTFDGATAYLISGINIITHLNKASAVCIVRIHPDLGASDFILASNIDTSPFAYNAYFYIGVSSSPDPEAGSSVALGKGGPNTDVAPEIVIAIPGTFSDLVLALNENYGYIDGTKDEQVIDTTWIGDAVAPDIYIGGSATIIDDIPSAVSGGFDGVVSAISFYNATLTDEQIAAITTAMQAL